MINNKNARSAQKFGLNLYRIRTDKNMSRATLADKVGLSDQRIVYDYENGIKYPAMERLVLIAVALDVSLDSLVS